MIEITTNKCTSGSCEIHFLSAGNPDNTSVILLHGMKFQAATWQELGTLEHIAEAGFHAIAIDMPGFGLSPACSAKQDKVLETFLQKTGQQKIILVGPSMGGQIALEFTINHPELVSALVLIGAVSVEENKKNDMPDDFGMNDSFADFVNDLTTSEKNENACSIDNPDCEGCGS